MTEVLNTHPWLGSHGYVKADLNSVKPGSMFVSQHPENINAENKGIDDSWDSDDVSLEDISDLSPDVQEAYKLACKEGSRPSHTTRLMLVGHYGAGKTSLKRCLLNKPFIPGYNITNGIDVDPSHCRVDIDKISNWKHIEGEPNKDSYNEELLKAVRQLLHKGQQKRKGEAKNDSDREEMASMIRRLLLQVQEESKEETVSVTKCAAVEAATPGDLPLVEPDRELLQQLDKVRSAPAEHPEDGFSVWDFAGQSTFYATHQVFLTHRAIYLVVLDIMQALDSPINTDQLEFKETTHNGISSQPIIDQLDYWMKCISTHTSARVEDTASAESIIIVLTHKDQLQEQYGAKASQKIRDYHRSIMDHIKQKAYYNRVHLQFFTVANNSEGDPELDRLRETIVELARSQPYWGEEIPLKWIALKHQMIKKKTPDCHVTRFEEAWEICKSPTVNISSKTELVNLLRFYHEMGELVYFDDNNLRGHIILEPQWVIDAICKVITIPQFQQSSDSSEVKRQWQILSQHGLLTATILQDVWRSDIIEHLKNLMYKFRLMVPMRICQMTDIHKKMVQLKIPENEAFLVPCLLEKCQRVDPVFSSTKPIIPEVLIIFPGGFIPVGITSHLISGLVMNEAWLLTDKVFQNHATFLPEGPNTNLSITIHQHEDRLHLQGHILDDKPPRPNCLRPYLFVLLEQLGFVVRSSCPKATFELAVECGCDNPERSIVKIGSTGEWIEGNVSIFCHQHQTKFLTDSYSPWFDIKSPKSLKMLTGTANLTDQTLLEVARQLGPEWRGLGYRLVESHVVEDLCTPLQGGAGLYGLRMLVRWQQGLGGVDISGMKDRLMPVLEGRADLKQIITEYNGPNEQLLFHKLSRGLTKIWREVGEKLGVGAADMDAIETPQMPDYNPGLRMLVTWRDQGGCRTELITHLKELKLHAIAQSLALPVETIIVANEKRASTRPNITRQKPKRVEKMDSSIFFIRETPDEIMLLLPSDRDSRKK